MRLINIKNRELSTLLDEESLLRDFSIYFNSEGKGNAWSWDGLIYEKNFDLIEKIKYKEIAKKWIVFEVKTSDAEFIANDSNLPDPNLIIREVDDLSGIRHGYAKPGKANLFYKLSKPVTSISSRENIRLRVDIENGFNKALGVNKSFNKKYIRNPFYEKFQVLVSDIEPYGLEELSEYILNKVDPVEVENPSLLCSNRDVFDYLIRFVSDRDYLRDMDKDDFVAEVEDAAFKANSLLGSVLEQDELALIVKAVVEQEFKEKFELKLV